MAAKKKERKKERVMRWIRERPCFNKGRKAKEDLEDGMWANGVWRHRRVRNKNAGAGFNFYSTSCALVAPQPRLCLARCVDIVSH